MPGKPTIAMTPISAEAGESWLTATTSAARHAIPAIDSGDREAVWHPRGEQHETRQEPGQARSVRLQPHQRRRTGQEHYGENDADRRAAIAGLQRAQPAQREPGHGNRGSLRRGSRAPDSGRW